MSSRKPISSLSERQVRRKIAAERGKLNQQSFENLFEYNKIIQGFNNANNSEELHINECTDDKFKKNCYENNDINFACIMKDLRSEKNVAIQNKQYQLSTEITESSTSFEESMNVSNFEEKKEDTQSTLFDIINYIKNVDYTDEDANSETESEEELMIDENDEKLQFVDNIRNICVKHIHTITHEFINDLLHELRKGTDAPFPKDSRTLLKTPRSTEIFNMSNGQYCHYGFKSAITNFIIMYEKKGINVDCLKLLLSIDGAPLAKNSEKGAWIISCSESILKSVELIGIYYGDEKPKDSNELVSMSVEELINFINNGIKYEEKQYGIILYGLICDTPAKAYILKIKYHSGYWSCTKCTIKGEYENYVHFPEGEVTSLRTDEDFRNKKYNVSKFDEFQQGETILNNIPNFGLITNVPLDYMHLVCLGVMLKLIELWIHNSKHILSDSQRIKISERLLNFKNFTPSDFGRNPRQFKNIRRLWKAYELRTFLIYTGPIALYNILPEHLYLHFLYLHIAISILINPILSKDESYLNYADFLLKKFVEDFQKYYGKKNMVFNIHNLLHLVNDVRYFGSLDNFSAFRYENLIRKIKQLLRKGDKPLQQIARRLIEIRELNTHEENENETNLSTLPKKKAFEILKKDSLYLDCRSEKNNCVLLNNGIFIKCIYFIKEDDDKVHVIGKPLEIIGNFYNEPLSSDHLNIKTVKLTEKIQNIYSLESIFAKVCKLPLKDYFVAIPIHHTYKNN